MVKRTINIARMVRAFLLLLLTAGALQLALPSDAEARAGGRRSFGRSPSRPAPAQQYRPQPNTPPSNGAPAAQPQRGGFARGLAGGLAGGFLGSMLFSSMGHAAGGMGGSGGGGGIGLIEIILIAGLAYLAFRWWKNRQNLAAAQSGGSGPGTTSSMFSGLGANQNVNPANAYNQNQPLQNLAPAPNDAGYYAAEGGPSIEPDEASDIFFKVQAAWTRRDVASIAERLGSEVYQTLKADLSELKAKKQINRLENISVRKVDILDRWNEHGNEYARVRFTANLLDYTVDEQSGNVVEGSNTDPVKFEEDWTFSRTTANGLWQLVGISQV